MSDLINKDRIITVKPGTISVGTTQPNRSLKLGAKSIADINTFINNPVLPNPTDPEINPHTARFTYSLSWGWRCKISQRVFHKDNAYDCGVAIEAAGGSFFICNDL